MEEASQLRRQRLRLPLRAPLHPFLRNLQTGLLCMVSVVGKDGLDQLRVLKALVRP